MRPGSRSASEYEIRTLLRGAFRARGPFWRPVDRARSRARLLLLLGLLAAVLFGCAVAGQGVSAAPDRARAEAHRAHLVDAEVLGPVHQEAGAVVTRFRVGELVTVRWTYPAFHLMQGRVDLPVPARTGSTIQLWVDDGGRLSDPPQGTPWLVLLSLGTGAAGWLVLSAAALALFGLYGRLLRRRTERYWAAGWAAVEPHWSGRARR
ncbi:hypothetical protein ACFYNO_13140 [Kitasatospora sp. NPDC006697]|uniref:Rv1733c family protein n=1 Tax=Kitasatospora sp. NPDC006697 TaxID=3364020 RepID=UPI00369EDF10